MYAERVLGNGLTWLQMPKGPGQTIFKMENQKGHYCNSAWVWKLQNWETNSWYKTHSPHTKALTVLVSNTWRMACFEKEGRGGFSLLLFSPSLWLVAHWNSLSGYIYIEDGASPPSVNWPTHQSFWEIHPEIMSHQLCCYPLIYSNFSKQADP